MLRSTTVEDLRAVQAAVEIVCGELDPDAVPDERVREGYESLVAMERLVTGARTRMQRRVAEAGAWHGGGDRNAEDFVARTTGSTRAQAKASLDTSRRLGKLDAVDAAVAAGELSAEQATAVADAAAADPAAQESLLAKAAEVSVSELREEARRVKAAADPDPETTGRRIHDRRFLRRWNDAEGGYNLAYRNTPEIGARIDALLQPFLDRVWATARAQGRREHPDAYAADALLDALRGHDPATPTDDAGRAEQAVVPEPAEPAAQGVSRPGGGDARATFGMTGDDGAVGDDGPSANDGSSARPVLAPKAGASHESGAAAELAAATGSAAAAGSGAEGVEQWAGWEPDEPVGEPPAWDGDAELGEPDIDTMLALWALPPLTPAPDDDDEPPPEQPPHGWGAFATQPAKPRAGARSRARETKVLATVDLAALRRGHIEGGETCEIAGAGPVPLATARALLGEAFLAIVIRDGVDVLNVTHLGRQVTAHQRTALEARGYRCEVPGCPARHHLEIDHITEWQWTKHTRLDDLAWLCGFHHDGKTHHGWTLHGPPGQRQWRNPAGDVVAGSRDPTHTA